MITITLAFVAGVLLLQLMPALPPWYGYVLVPLCLGCLRWRLAWLPAALVIGFFWAAGRAELALRPVLDPALEGQTVLIEGRVVDIPRRMSGRDYRLLFAADRMDAGNGWEAYPATVRLGWYRTTTVPASGDRWQLAVRLKQPHGYANPGGFDYERWLFQQRIRATGYVRKDARNQLLGHNQSGYVDNLRAVIAAHFDRMAPATPGLGLIRALVIGDRNAITPAQWEILRATGTSHLMAISGLHISLVSGLVFLLVRGAWARSGRLPERIPAARAAAVLALAAGLFYALLAGFGIPTRRALIMLCVAMLAVLAGRYVRATHVLCVAVIAVLILDPLSVLAPGWWLSFWAVALLVYIAAGRHGQEGKWRQWTRAHLVLAFGLLPLLLVLFQQASLVAPLANVVAVPLTGLLIVPLALVGGLLVAVSPWASEQVLGLAAWLMDMLWPWLELLGRPDFSSLQQHAPLAWTLVPATAGVLLLLAPRGTPGRWLGTVLLLPLVAVRPAAPAAGEVQATLLDVGQGLSVVVRTRQHTLVYDTGPSYSPTFDTGQAVVTPFLRHQGVERIDRLVISHGDNDHIGGARSLLGAFPVDQLTAGVPGLIEDREAGACRRGDRWVWDGVEFVVLHPGPGSRHTGNNASCVIRITSTGGQRLLLTGDIEALAEQALLDSGSTLAAEVMTVPHHGSMTSSSAAFIRAVAPDYALFPVGYRNRYRLPREQVVERYRAGGARLFDSARHGAISVHLPAVPGDVVPGGWRCRQRRYWRSGRCSE